MRRMFFKHSDFWRFVRRRFPKHPDIWGYPEAKLFACFAIIGLLIALFSGAITRAFPTANVFEILQFDLAVTGAMSAFTLLNLFMGDVLFARRNKINGEIRLQLLSNLVMKIVLFVVFCLYGYVAFVSMILPDRPDTVGNEMYRVLVQSVNVVRFLALLTLNLFINFRLWIRLKLDMYAHQRILKGMMRRSGDNVGVS